MDHNGSLAVLQTGSRWFFNYITSQASDKHMSRVMRKPFFALCENKDADQLRGNREADQRLCFRYTDSTIPLLPKFEISSLKPSSVTCTTWFVSDEVGNQNAGFLMTRLIRSILKIAIQSTQHNCCSLPRYYT